MFNIRGTEQLSSMDISLAEYLLAILMLMGGRRRDRQKCVICIDFAHCDDCTQNSLGTPECKKDRASTHKKMCVAL